MRNITISLEDEVYRKVRLLAAERDTSLSGLVRQLVTEATGKETEFERSRLRQNELIEQFRRKQRESGQYFNAADRLSREEIHDRNALRRLEHSAVRDR